MKNSFASDHVKYWRLDKLSDAITHCEKSICTYLKETNIQVKQDYQNIVLDICFKAILTFRELVILSQHGYPDGALGLARNLYEQGILLSFFEIERKQKTEKEFNKIVSDYFIDHEVKRLKLLKYDVEKCNNNSVSLSEVEKMIDDQKKQTNSSVKADYWWIGKKHFADVAESVTQSKDSSLRSHYYKQHFIYKFSCSELHANCSGNAFRLSSTRYGDNYTGPTTKGHDLPLWFATSLMVDIVEASSRVLGISYYDNCNKLLELESFYRQKLEINI